MFRLYPASWDVDGLFVCLADKVSGGVRGSCPRNQVVHDL